MSGSEETFQRIQREISEVVQREKELKNNYARSQSTSALLDHNTTLLSNGSNGSSVNGDSLSINNEEINVSYERAHSVSSVNERKTSVDNNRLFKPNTTSKGVMHRFIKSRGKVQGFSPISNGAKTPSDTWNNSDVIEPPKVQPGKSPRNGFVPVEERIRREFEEMQLRERELKTERRKSQPDLMIAIDEPPSPPPEHASIRSAKSFTHLNELEDFTDVSAPVSLKSARSLAELCDVENDEELQTPSNLIRQWESIIQKNQQVRI
ncbi:uncharacterized protein LOC108733357 [Agrilus planipennis]|uniref:Uncharacterized protein LOC108733357 n=1 Tax=Agrilus planipennis TaxID=224129 RepID=A0A1W4WHN9_AGRPL|nr:uncharacterized protein LOC108733357 [Agrilus planipennis]XP_018319982.1 uncharacterized protein LOC108733357 [Agrilus planipennis]